MRNRRALAKDSRREERLVSLLELIVGMETKNSININLLIAIVEFQRPITCKWHFSEGASETRHG
jgi:hypothetical protein